jgi:1-phosphofructokinase family hexose kinase
MIYTVTLNTAVDRIVQIHGRLTRKANNKTKSVQYDIGGKATHVSVVLSALNIPNIATGVIGGKTGAQMVSLMELKGVTCKFLEQKDCETRESIILVDESGEGSYMITQKGFPLSSESIERLKSFLEENVKEEDIVVFAGSPPHELDVDIYGSILSVAKKQGARIVVDAAGAYLRKALDYHPFLIKPNEFEYQEFINLKCETIEDYVNALRTHELNTEVTIVSLGKRGALAKKGNEIVYVIPPTINEVNETGAGDFFVGGLVAKIYENASVEDMLRTAAAIGASKAMQEGSSSFELSDIEILLAQCKIERKV